MRKLLFASLAIATATVLACSGASNDDDSSTSADELAASCPTVLEPIPSKSLFVTDATVLAKFSIGRTLNQIASTGDTSGLTGIELYQQMLDTLNDAAGGVTKGPHCNGTLNGFPTECPRVEGRLASTDPTSTGPDGYIPIGIVNRFDLAPANGDNCGQFRIVYGKRSGLTNGFDRTLIIFEAVLPNPTPANGIAACRPIELLWNGLSNPSVTEAQAATKLANFYYAGVDGFSPVVNAAHYGFGNTANTGQIRMNTFNGDWQLREFRLAQTCSGTPSVCKMLAKNTFVQDNPEGTLFGGSDSKSLAFQKEFISQVPSLASKDINLIGMSTPNVDNAGESDEQSTQSDDLANGQNNAALTSAITTKLKSLKSDLTADDILNRATTQGCAGCHEVAIGRSLGDGLVWPFSNGFTQIDERSTLSPALTGTFLPFRAGVQLSYLDTQCHQSPPDGGTGTDSGAPKDSGVGLDAAPPPKDGGGGETDGGSSAGDASTGGGGGASDASAPPPVPLTIGGGVVGASN